MLTSYFQDFSVETVAFRIFLAVLLGGLLGLERQRKNSPAGLRTNILVCLGACLIMMTNQYITIMYNGAGDPSRMGAQVVSGIGFLGAGSIITTGRNQIRGITTAACLWTSAGCGLAIGIGFYEGAVIGVAAILLVVTTLGRMDRFIRKKSKYLEVYIEYKTEKYSFSKYIEYIRSNEFDIINIQAAQDLPDGISAGTGRSGYILTLASKKKRSHGEMMEIVLKEIGVRFVQEL